MVGAVVTESHPASAAAQSRAMIPLRMMVSFVVGLRDRLYHKAVVVSLS
jgi:hypothetical protein